MIFPTSLLEEEGYKQKTDKSIYTVYSTMLTSAKVTSSMPTAFGIIMVYILKPTAVQETLRELETYSHDLPGIF